MNNQLTPDQINRYLEEFSKERTELMKKLKETTTVAGEGPIKQKLQAVQGIEERLLKIRTIDRKEAEKIM